MSFDRNPRGLDVALRRVRADTAPKTLLAAVQAAWREAAGDRVAGEAEPVSEHDGVVTIACRSATWANELDMLQEPLLERLNAALEAGPQGPAAGLRFTADAARHDRPAR